MRTDPYTHMEEAFGLDENPFPAEAISSGAETERYSDLVFPEETREFRLKMIRGGLQGGRKTGFLWSRSPAGEDTGFGKTTLMRNTTRAINGDFGASVQENLGIKPDRIKPIVASFAELNEQSRNGLYPVLFAATQNLAGGPDAVMAAIRQQLLAQAGDDKDQMRDMIMESQMRVAPSGQALRRDMLEAFVDSDTGLAELLAGVSDASRLRNGIQYFTGALYILAAAGIEKVFLMIDQLEDLGKKGALSAAKRRREIGRIRDMLEIEPFASRLHKSFTIHQAAAQNLALDWDANRLPSFDTSSANASAVVVLHGLQREDQVEELLRAWMEPVRNEHAGTSPISPFTPDVLGILRSLSQGRAGVLLYRASELLYAGAEAQVGEIDGAFARQHFAGQGHLAAVAASDDDAGADYDDLLA
jgi:hypothetical protein